MNELILIADDDPDILRFVELNLTLEGFEVVTASDGEQALSLAREHLPSLVILDVMMPKLDGYEVCQQLRDDGRTNHMSIIMLTAKVMSADKVLGLTAGADDYISKPFDPMELVARVKTTLRRTREIRAVSPLTGFPGNMQIDEQLQRHVEAGDDFAVLWLDLDNFKAFNDRYGFSEGDKAILYLARLLREVTGPYPDSFLGHIGGDDFVLISRSVDATTLCEQLVVGFDRDVASLYEPEDAARGSITVKDRLGNERAFELLSLSIGGATSDGRNIEDRREIVEVATEMKTFAKSQPGSVFAIDRRREN